VRANAALSPDALAIVLVCSSLALDAAAEVKPLTPGEWHTLAVALRESTLQRPRELLGRSGDELREQLDVSAEMGVRLEALLARGGQLALALERLAGRGIWVLTRADDRYPTLLKQQLRGQAPPLLFGAGSQERLDAPAIAIVGSRDVDDQGLELSTALGRRCAQQGFAVVSGAARGVDATAMAGSLDAGGLALGITVDPLERLVRRRDLREPLSEGTLTLMTPFRPDARWHAGNAMRRNRLVYALSRAAVVVASSAARGGTRAGALENLKAGWVPLWVRDDGTPGAEDLIAAGARALPTQLDGLDLERLGAAAPPVQAPLPVVLPPVFEVPTAAAPAAPKDDDLFVCVWPVLARYLGEPRSVEDVSQHFDLAPTQVRAWLKRAEQDEFVEATRRPRRYVLARPEQEPLFPSVRAVGA